MSTWRFGNDLRKRIFGFQCVYCGQTADAQDHFPPATHSRQGVILPACGECNGLAGTEWSEDFARRCEHVKKRLRIKHARILAVPDWSGLEFRDTSGRFQRWVKASILRRDHIRERLAWNAVAYLQSIDRSNYFAALHAETDISLDDESECLPTTKRWSAREERKKYRRSYRR